MTDAPALTDDEALWFPVHMSTGDSFSHTANEPGDLGDGIGLPGRNGGGRPPKKPGIKASSWLWLTLWGVAAVGIVTVAARKEIAAELAQNWLRGQGVHARLKFDQLSLSHLKGHIVIGDAANPEVSIDSFETDYSLNFFNAGQPLARIRTLHLSHPVVTVAFKGGQLDFGSLNKLVHDSLNAPPSNAPPPELVVVDNADVRLLSDYGQIRAAGGLTLKDGRLGLLTLKVPATHLSGALGEGDLSGADVDVRTVHSDAYGDQLAVRASAAASSLGFGTASPVEDADTARDLHLADVVLDVDARLPYRNSKAFADAFSGAAQSRFALKASEFDGGGARATDLDATVALDGTMKIADQGESFTGRAQLQSQAAGLTSGDIDAKGLAVDGPALAVSGALDSKGIAFSLNGPATAELASLHQGDLNAANARLKFDTLALDLGNAGVNASFKGGLNAGHLASGDITLDGTTASLSGVAHSDSASGQWGVTFSSDLTGTGQYKGLNAVAKGQAEAAAELARRPAQPGVPPPPPPGPDSIVALDRALSRFTLRASGLNISVNAAGSAPPQIDIRARMPAVIDLTGGGKATVTPLNGQPLLASGKAGGFGVTLDGPDLPQVKLDVSGFGFDRAGNPGGAYTVVASLNATPVSGIVVDGHGHFVLAASGDLSATLDAPAAFTAQAAELGDHLTGLKGTISQAGDTFLVSGPSGFRVNGAFHGVALDAPNELVAVTGAEGTFQAFSIPGSSVTGLKATVTAADVKDASPAGQTRFNPLMVTGTLTQDARAMTGRFLASAKTPSPKPVPVADIALDADPVSGKGALTVDTRDYLTFARGGLQPVQLTPTVAVVLSKDVSGKAHFSGGFTFDKDSAASSGVLTLDGLNFTGATGVSQGLNGKIVFTSLSPLTSDPHQQIMLASMQVGVPLTNLEMRFQFLGDHMAVENADVTTPGGPVLLQPMTVPFDGKSPISGTVTFDGLDFGKIIAATNLGQSMTFQGTLSGKLPFVVSNGRVGLVQGFMASDASGEISIKRASVTDVQASGSVSSPDTKAAPAAAEPAFNPFEDLAYQAMEHLHYDQIDARINSLDTGAIDLNFHIKGHFDPPQKQKATISLFDYISGKWMQKPIKLPSGTPVELYLDVPLNLNDVFSGLSAASGGQ